jgi:hypothetical protein
MEKPKKITANYNFDQFLMYLIQDVTKKSSAEILSFFYDLARQVCVIGVEKMRVNQGAIDKKIDDFFPGTSIPFHMRVKGHKYTNRWNPHTRQYEDQESVFNAIVDVGFPDRPTYLNEKSLNHVCEALLEQTLLGGEVVPVPPFEKPQPSSGKMYKKLMDEVVGRHTGEEPKKRNKKKLKTDTPETAQDFIENAFGLPNDPGTV